MQLAPDHIVIDLPASVTLRVSLRAAFRLNRKYRGFEKLVRLIFDGHLSAISDVIAEGSGETIAPEYLEGVPLHEAMDRLISPTISYVMLLAQSHLSDDKPGKPTGERITLEQLYLSLFRAATGALGWTPSTAWGSTPAEIIEACKGKADAHGSKDKEDEEVDLSDRAAVESLNALGNLNNHEMPV